MTTAGRLRREGREEGRVRGQSALLASAEQRARIDAADAETLTRWTDRLFTAPDLETLLD